MRLYATIPVNIWVSEMTMQLRKKGTNHICVAMYMLCASNSNMIGLYRLTTHDIGSHLGMSTAEAEDILKSLIEMDFCRYDWEREYVWVIEHALMQTGQLKPNDNRCKAVKKVLNMLPKVSFMEEFIAYYDDILCINDKPLRSKDQVHYQNSPLSKEVLSSRLNDDGFVDELDDCDNGVDANPIKKIFTYWQHTLNHPKARLDSKRERVIRKALENYNICELEQAINGCAQSAFHMGENDCVKKYDDITLILRDASHIEDFMHLAENPTIESSGKFSELFEGAR